MAKKRGNGEGSISKRPNGRWMAQITLSRDPSTGKAKRLTRYGKTRQEVSEWLKQTGAEVSKGNYAVGSDLTLEEWLKRWLDTVKPNVRQSTYDSYETTVRIHITPELGNVKLKDLRPEHLQALYNQKLSEKRADGKKNLSPTTIGYIHGVIHHALRQAMKEQLVIRNVAEAVSKPRRTRHEIQPLTPDQLQQFLQIAKPHPLYPAFLLEWATGLRRGELLGLRWQDIDFDRKLINIRQSLIQTRQGLQLSEPKTKKSRRSIPVPQQVIEELQRHHTAQQHNRELAGEAYEAGDLIFCNPLGHPIDPRGFLRKFQQLLDDSDLPHVRFHDLRHSHATLLLTLGEHPKVVQERLGHSTISMTLDTYSHVLPHMQEKVADRLSTLLPPTHAD